jgi:anti-anti-sigma regulatory factor
VNASRALPSISTHDEGVVVRVHGRLDVESVQRICGVVDDYLDLGGSIRGVVLDLHGTSRCDMEALRGIAGLVAAGVGLRRRRAHAADMVQLPVSQAAAR